MDKKFALGFISGEGSFSAKVQKKPSNDIPVRVVPCFEMHLQERERQTAKSLANELPLDVSVYEKQNTDGVGGSVQIYAGGYTKLDSLIEWIDSANCSSFEKSNKYKSYKKFKQIIQLMKEGKHKEEQGIIEIMKIRDSMNGAGGKDKLSSDEVRKMINEK